MKRIVEETGEGLEKLLGERITLFCLNYMYTGKLVGINERYVLLTDPAAVAQKLPHELYVMLACVEAFGLMK